MPGDREVKKQALAAVYNVYAEWAECFPLACRKGCSACCTRSVTMSSLEGAVIMDYINSKGRENWLREKLAQAGPGPSRVGITTNQFAAACLNRREVDGEALGSWDFAPCIFLLEDACPIYAVRPFGCRSFGSLVRCAADSAAVIAPIHLAVNTVFTQVIEHLSSDGGYWSTMAGILQSLADDRETARNMHLQPARPVPGFLLEPGEVQAVKVLLQQLNGLVPAKGIFGDLIDNFMPI